MAAIDRIVRMARVKVLNGGLSNDCGT